jgi:hypothetical protein
MLRYVVPFARLDRWVDSRSDPQSGDIDMAYFDYIGLIRRLIEPVFVDEAWYLQAYPGVGQAIARGAIASAAHHYLSHGYFENRLPFAPDRQDYRAPWPYRELRAQTRVRPDRRGLRALMSKASLMGVVQRLLAAVPVDEAWYRATYKGVDAAIGRGNFASASAHYTKYGYAESRWPFFMRVDADWYLHRYPDVRALIGEGVVASAQEHFWSFGYREGRFPAGAPDQCLA